MWTPLVPVCEGVVHRELLLQVLDLLLVLLHQRHWIQLDVYLSTHKHTHARTKLHREQGQQCQAAATASTTTIGSNSPPTAQTTQHRPPRTDASLRTRIILDASRSVDIVSSM
jgi:hypothetical protein